MDVDDAVKTQMRMVEKMAREISRGKAAENRDADAAGMENRSPCSPRMNCFFVFDPVFLCR
jgi:hypothetical protein